MATLANIFDPYNRPNGAEQVSPRARVLEPEDPFEVPLFPNEDVYFYVKRIVNTAVPRETDPVSRRKCWKMIGYAFLAATLVISLLLPNLYRLMAGYQMEALRQERQRLELDRSGLELQESRLVSPARLEELARMQRFVDPSPDSVVYLDNKSDDILAKK